MTNKFISSLKNRIETLEKALNSQAQREGILKGGCESFLNLGDFNFGKNIAESNLTPEGKAFNLDINSTHWNLKISDNRIFFEGPSSSRYIPSSSYCGAKGLKNTIPLFSLDDYHQKIFTWYFSTMNVSLPLLNEELFMSSLRHSVENDVSSDFAPSCLVNCIMAIWFLDNRKEHDDFVSLAKKQVNMEVEKGPSLSTV